MLKFLLQPLGTVLLQLAQDGAGLVAEAPRCFCALVLPLLVALLQGVCAQAEVLGQFSLPLL